MQELFNKEILTEEDIHLIIDSKMEESIHLDFKQSDSLGRNEKKKAELAKDVSAFANSAGGHIVYGIVEKNHMADSFSYIDGNDITKEWIEQVLQTRIQRKIEGLRIVPVRIDNDIKKSVYVLSIPESSLAPHMTSDKRFYKRYNFESVQMEEYEIRNLCNRTEKTKLLIGGITSSRNIEYEEGYEFYKLGFQIENIGQAIEKHYKLIITLNFTDYNLKFDPFIDSKPNRFIKPNGDHAISFSNTDPIFPNEIMTLANMKFGFLRSRREELMQYGKFNMELLYSNGKDEFTVDLNAVVKRVDHS